MPNNLPLKSKYEQNDVLVNHLDRIIFLPGYMRVKIKQINNFDMTSLQAQLNLDIILNIFYGGLNQELILPLLKNNIVLLFEKSQACYASQKDGQDKNLQTKIKVYKEQQQIKITVRKTLSARVQGQVLNTPFNIMNMILSVTIQAIQFSMAQLKIQQVQGEEVQQKTFNQEMQINKLQYQEQQKQQQSKPERKGADVKVNKWTLKFNLMDLSSEDQVNQMQQNNLQLNRQENYTSGIMDSKSNGLSKTQRLDYQKTMFKYQFQKLSFVDQLSYGSYFLAPSKIKTFYSNKKVSSVKDFRQQKQQDLNQLVFKSQEQEAEIMDMEPFQYAHFKIPLYKTPLQGILKIFLPLLLLGIINIGIFFQDSALQNRIASITTLLIAFVGLIPIIQKQIPKNKHVTIIELLVYMQSFTTLLVFIHSVNYRFYDPKQFSLGYQTYVFDNGLFWTAVAIDIVIVIWIIVMSLLYIFYLKPKYLNFEKSSIGFKRQQWSNKICRRNFQNLITRKQFMTKEDWVHVIRANIQNQGLQKIVEDANLKNKWC